MSPNNTAPDTSGSNAAAKVVDAFTKRENFNLLITKESLAKDIASWLSQHAKLPTELSTAPVEWLVYQAFMRTGLHVFAARYGSFKSIMALFLALALMTGTPYLGRATQTQFGEDTRPLHIYYLDRENPQSYARACCLHISLGFVEGENGNVFRVLGEWQDEPQPILRFDDPRLIEAARRERAFFIFDSLSQFIGGGNENDNAVMTVELNKAKALARISEGVLVLHHDDKGASGWRGCTAIIAVPDMCFNLKRGEGNLVTFSAIKFRETQEYEITARVSFGNDEDGFDKRYSYEVVDSTPMGASARATKKAERLEGDKTLIEKARLEIEKNAKAGKKALSQNKLAQLVGIVSASVRDRVLCQNTDDTPRPWKMVPGNVSLEFHPEETQAAIVADPMQMAMADV